MLLYFVARLRFVYSSLISMLVRCASRCFPNYICEDNKNWRKYITCEKFMAVLVLVRTLIQKIMFSITVFLFK